MPVDLRDAAAGSWREVHVPPRRRRPARGDPAQRRQARALLLPARDDEPRAVIPLDDDEARQLGAVIGGAYERPKIVEDLEMALGELQIEWVPVPDTSPRSARRSPSAGSGQTTGVTVIAILREPEPISGAQPDDVIQQGDTLVTVGKAGQYPTFRRLLAGAPDA